MRKNALFLFLLSCVALCATPLQDYSFSEQELRKLASALGFPPDADLNAQMQKHCLRKPDQERWEMAELSEDKYAFVLNWAQGQGIWKERLPVQSHYNKALILGATTSRMEKRLHCLCDAWNRGVRFDEVVWLTGRRPLDPRVDAPLPDCSDESEAARSIWAHASLPDAMRSLPVVFVEVPMQKENGIQKRPNTKDTLDAWMSQHSPKPCSALFVSDQPFCGYQWAIIKTTLPDTIDFDVIGAGADPTSHPAAAAVTLDSVARQIYAERQ
jgi:hypothetical protein